MTNEKHSGKCIVRYNEKTETWTVLCPKGHFITTIDNPNGMYGIDYYKNKNVTCEGSI